MDEAGNALMTSDRLSGLLTENEAMAAELIATSKTLFAENENLTSDLVAANRSLALKNETLTTELVLAQRMIADQMEDEKDRVMESAASDQERLSRQEEKEERAAELIVANEELEFQQGEKRKRAAELVQVKHQLALERECGERAAALSIANGQLAAQNRELEQRAAQLVASNKVRLELLAQLLQSQKLESLGTLAGGIAHDMNNVLGAILGLATAHLEIQPPESAAHQAFTTIAKAAVRGGKMAKSLLNFARQSPAEEHELDVNTILREEVRLLERTTLSKVNLSLELAPDLRPMRGDASALTHAFMNLCVNAVEAMADQGTLTLRTQNLEGDWIEVRVSDTGTGMPPEVLETCLNPFFTTKGVGKGTGLGLSLVYSAVKAHGGHLDIQSEPGRGTQVTMRFPTYEPSPGLQQSEAEAPPGPPLLHLAVLLVDDDELMQSSTRAILECLGHTVTGVANGEEALARIEAGYLPDAVILDINMPGLGGARTLARLRGLRATLPVLLSTGRVDQAALTLVEAHPGVGLLPKPFSLKELKAHLEALVQGGAIP
ncbi:MAG: response regulator [Holophagaceae bacterium]|nr:response regulator [Holophagaceae bacterium]